jgi:hypothetical protein
MDEQVNPYASPQADLGGAPLVEGTPLDLPGMKTIGIGLSLVYYGIVIVLLAMFCLFLGGMVLQSVPSRTTTTASAFAAFGLTTFGAMLLGCLMVFVGQVVCAAVPSITGAKVFALAAVVLQVASVAHSLLPLVQRLVPTLNPPWPVTILLNSLGAIGTVCFVLFMRRVSLFLARTDLARRARNVLIVGAILVAGIVALVFAAQSRQPDSTVPVAIFTLIVLVAALICFVMYANLVNSLRKVLLKKDPRRSNTPFVLWPNAKEKTR